MARDPCAGIQATNFFENLGNPFWIVFFIEVAIANMAKGLKNISNLLLYNFL